MDSKIYKYYLAPSSERYIKFEVVGGINGYNIFDSKTDNPVNILYQDGSTDLLPHELIEVGRAIEHHRYVQSGQVEYDPYFLWPTTCKKEHLQ